MELINTISKIGTNLDTALTMAKLIAPFAPFIAEDIWENLNQSESIHQQEWPTYDENILKEENVKIVLQINGKKRGLISAKTEINENALLELIKKDAVLSKYLKDKLIKRKIYIKNKLINIIV